MTGLLGAYYKRAESSIPGISGSISPNLNVMVSPGAGTGVLTQKNQNEIMPVESK